MAAGLYIHIPFCRSKCSYCDFASYPGLEGLFDAYVGALAQEMRLRGPARIETVYLGGGTPTALPLTHLERILCAARTAFEIASGAEVSVEANPGTVDVETLAALGAAGTTRLSLGVQSLNDAELRLLGRIHSAAEAAEAVGAARQAGFDNVNLDLIYGLPGQSPRSWQAGLEKAMGLRPEHLSLYALSVEEGTPLDARIAAGELPAPDSDAAAEMYELAEELLGAAGFHHYEISNWAIDAAHECRHNLTYWRNEPYLGVGAAAHSWWGGRRSANVARPEEYVARLAEGRPPAESEEPIGPGLEMAETMMMGLRLTAEGLACQRFADHFGTNLREQYAAELEELEGLGLVEVLADRVRLTRRGRLLGNQVFLRFVP